MCGLVLGGGADKVLWDVLVVLWPVPMAPLLKWPPEGHLGDEM